MTFFKNILCVNNDDNNRECDDNNREINISKSVCKIYG